MTKVKFFSDGEHLIGFRIEGHSTKNSDDQNGKLVCSAVSSAAYMAANTILEIIGDSAKAEVNDALMEIRVENPKEDTEVVLKGLKQHIEQLAEQYSNNIKISEV